MTRMVCVGSGTQSTHFTKLQSSSTSSQTLPQVVVLPFNMKSERRALLFLVVARLVLAVILHTCKQKTQRKG